MGDEPHSPCFANVVYLRIDQSVFFRHPHRITFLECRCANDRFSPFDAVPPLFQIDLDQETEMRIKTA